MGNMGRMFSPILVREKGKGERERGKTEKSKILEVRENAF